MVMYDTELNRSPSAYLYTAKSKSPQDLLIEDATTIRPNNGPVKGFDI
jgi:hypothetical protein